MPPTNIVPSSSLAALLADDDDNDVLLIRRAAKRLSMFKQLIVVPSGEEAIAHLETNFHNPGGDRCRTPDILVLDQFMPRWSGLDVLLWVRSCPHFEHLPVVILSLGLSPAQMEQARLLRAACCAKTPQLEDLPAAVEHAIHAAGGISNASVWSPIPEPHGNASQEPGSRLLAIRSTSRA
jgi:CheY-like chemotaxis protein